MQVARGEQFSLTRSDPAFPSRGLTLWTVTISGQQYLDVLATNPLAISLDQGSSSSAGEIGDLERRRG